jgi:outer membrane immunogenic protein
MLDFRFINHVRSWKHASMNKMLFVCVALASLSAAPAKAADMPPYPLPLPPPPVLVVPDPWTGFYVGGNVGYHMGQDNISSSVDPVGWGPAAAGILDSRSSSWLGSRGTVVGGQIGFNWQLRNIVFGWEADGEWLGGAANRQFTYANAIPIADGDFMYNSSAANVVATLRPRLGVAYGNLLFYGTAGLAMGWFSNTDSFSFFNGTFLTTTPSTTVRAGWTGGGGIEWKFLPAWSLKVEYLYLHMGNYNTTIPSCVPCAQGSDIAIHHNYTDNFVRVGVNWQMTPWW